MPVSPTEFLDFAKAVQANATMEREYRSVISRAHYAAYLTASEYRRTHPSPQPLTRTGSHERTWETFPGAIDIYGTRLKAKRHLSDYKIRQSVSKLDADAAIASAEQIIDLINALPP